MFGLFSKYDNDGWSLVHDLESLHSNFASAERALEKAKNELLEDEEVEYYIKELEVQS